jgi:hypothetical protein
MNVIFLDIDGVLRTDVSDRYWSEATGQPIPKSVFDRLFSSHSIAILNEIVYITGAKVVITSTWRVQHSLEQLRSIFKIRGFRGQIIDTTKIIGNRGEEIQEWLDTHVVNKYVVIDDSVKDILIHINPKRVVKIESNIGLNDIHFDSITDLLL